MKTYKYKVRNLKSPFVNTWICGIKSGQSEVEVKQHIRMKFEYSHQMVLADKDIVLYNADSLQGYSPELVILDELEGME